MNKLFYLIFLTLFSLSLINAQVTTESFETESVDSKLFLDNGVYFNIISYVGEFSIKNNPTKGWNDTSTDNQFIDNSSFTNNASLGIRTTSNLFKANRFWVFLSNSTFNQNVTGTLTITGKLSGITKFTNTKTSDFVTSKDRNNGYTLIDLTNLGGVNYSNITIDELVITLGGSYTYMAFDAFSWSKDSNTIPVLPPIITTQPNDITACLTNAVTFSITANNVTSYQWQVYDGSKFINLTDDDTYSGTTTPKLTVGFNDRKGFKYRCIVSGSEQVISNEATLTVVDLLTLVTANTPSEYKKNNGSATVSASGGTEPYTYFWTPSLKVGPTATGLAPGTYTVIVKDSTPNGYSSACSTSQKVEIKENAGIFTNVDSLSGFTTCVGTESSPKNFTIEAKGLTSDINIYAPSEYKISLSPNGTYNNSIILNSISDPLTIYVQLNSNTQGTQVGNITISSTGVPTQTVALSGTVTPAVNITAQPSNSTICEGQSTSFEATVTNATRYQWQVNSGSGFTDISNTGPYSGATTEILTISNATLAMSNNKYQLVATGDCTTISKSVSLIVNTLPTITVNPSNRIICAGGNTSFTATSEPNTTINWYDSETSTSPISTGNVFTTPTLKTTTSYWAESIFNNSITQVGPSSPTTQGGGINTQTIEWDVDFNVKIASTLQSIDIFPLEQEKGGEILIKNSLGTVIKEYPFTTTVSGGSTAQTITINHKFEPGNFKLDIKLPQGGITRNNSGAIYPYTSSVADILKNGYDSNYYMGLYNWKFLVGCSSSRKEVTVTVNDSPTPTTNKTTQEFCKISNPTFADIQINEANVIWYNAPTGGTTIPSTTTLSSGTFYASLTDSVIGCESSIRLAVVVNVSDSPTPTTSNTTQEFCKINNPTFADVQVNETGVIWYNSPTGGVIIPSTTALSNGTFYASLTDSVTGCESSIRLAIIVNVSDSATPTTSNTSQAFCKTNNPTFADIQVNEADVIWYNALTGGTIIPSTTALSNGIFYASLTNPTTGCISSTRLAITVAVSETPAPIIQQSRFCANSTLADVEATMNVVGTLKWYDAASAGNILSSVTKLVNGTSYYATQTTNGCESTRTQVIITINTISPNITIDNHVLCFGENTGKVSLTPSGGTSPYTYLWSDGSTSQNRNDLAVGPYTVVITDNIGCSISDSITITQPTALESTTTQTNVTAFGANNGSATVIVTGGTAPYTYSWSTIPMQSTATATDLSAGNYTVTIIDSNGCMQTNSVTITEPDALEATTRETNVSCNGGNNAEISINATGGVAPYTYTWSPLVSTSSIATGLSAGTYSILITDTNGNTLTKSVLITEPTVLTATTTSTNVKCNGGNDGSASVNITGGTGSYTYSWNTVPVQTTATATNLPKGPYTVTIIDDNGCTLTKTITITEPTPLMATTTSTNVICNGANNGSASVKVTGGTGSYTYSWDTSPVQTTATATNLTAGSYTITITDTNGCTITKSVMITQPNPLIATATSINTCNGGQNGSATIHVTGGSGIYNYLWNDTSAQKTATATDLAPGNYTVIITDSNACTITKTVTIAPSTLVPAPTGNIMQSFNSGDSLSHFILNGQNIKWYATEFDASTHQNSLPNTSLITNNTTYYATQTINDCESLTYFTILTVNTASRFKIYPNPVSDILYLRGIDTINKVIIYSFDGRKVIEKEIVGIHRNVDVHSLAQGNYTIQIYTDKEIKTFTFIKK